MEGITAGMVLLTVAVLAGLFFLVGLVITIHMGWSWKRFIKEILNLLPF